MAKFSKGWAFVGMSVATTLAFAFGCSQSSDLTEGSVADLSGSSGLVISQVYGGGGNAHATFKTDFVELFNKGAQDIKMDGSLSLQYVGSTKPFSATGDNSLVKLDSGKTIKPGQYYLVKLSGGGPDAAAPDPTTIDLPAFDQEGALNLGSKNGKVAIVPSDSPLDGCGTTAAGATLCPAAKWIDLVGYGTGTTQFEGSGPAPDIDNTSSAARTDGNAVATGCAVTGDNGADFQKLSPPKPRSLADAQIVCPAASDAGSDADADAATHDAAADADADTGAKPPKTKDASAEAEASAPRPRPDAAVGDDDDDNGPVEEETGDQPKAKPAPKAPLRSGSSSCSMGPVPGTDMSGGISAAFGLALVAASFRARRKK